MAKIENTVVYPLVKPQANDYVVLTDVSDDNATKTCLVGDLFSHHHPWYQFDRTLTTSEVLNAENNPVILINNQGLGTIVMPEYADTVASTISNTTVGVTPVKFNIQDEARIASANTGFTGGVRIYAYDQDNVNQVAPGSTPVASVYGTRRAVGDNTYGSSLLDLVNSRIIFTYDTGNGPTVGNGTIRITFRYKILTGFNI